MPQPTPLKYRELRQRLAPFGVTEKTGKKTSVRLLQRLGSNGKGPSYPFGVPGEGTEIDLPTIKAALRRLLTDEEQKKFWS